MAAETAARPRLASAVANDVAPEPRAPLRFITCGSVDDGKSTLIGRLLFEAGAIPDDVLATLDADSARDGSTPGERDYSLLVDGLSAEREQGITIDVAYRYFATARRAFVVADTPGHEQYTRNMATGASGADLAVILIDARKGVLPQTRRHSLIVSLVGVRHVVVAVNKIDLVGYDAGTVRRIEARYRHAIAGLGFETVTVIPVSARAGDNVATRSANTPWYDGPTLLAWLENVQAGAAAGLRDFVMPVQWVNRPDQDFRGFAGTIAAGAIRPGDAVVALPSGERTTLSRIVTFDGDLERASAGMAVTLTLDRDVDVSRGDVLIAARLPRDPALAARMSAQVRLLVTGDVTVAPGETYLVRLGTATASARIETILHGIDVATFDTRPAGALATNDLGLVRLVFDRPLVVTPYALVRELGALILIDRVTNTTAAMGVVAEATPAESGRVLAFRCAAGRTLAGTLGPDWRRHLAPATSWRLGSAVLLGVVVGTVTADPGLGAIAAALDAVLRTALRFVHRDAWVRARRRAESKNDASRDGGGI